MAALQRALERFSGDLRGLTSRVSDGVNGLKRGAESRPHAGVDAFRENLEDLEQHVADISGDVQQLERCTVDAISFDELLGHCVELYHRNRRGAAALVTHLERYGYQEPPGAKEEPEDPCSTAAWGLDECCFGEDDGDADAMIMGSPVASSKQLDQDGHHAGMNQQQHQKRYGTGATSTASSPGARRPTVTHAPLPSRSLPASPVSSGLLGAGYVPSRLGIGQPGSPARGNAAAAAAAAAAFALGGPAVMAAAGGGATASKLAHNSRRSIGGVSYASSTPEGLSLLSPGLVDKYACPSSSEPSAGGEPSLASGGSTAPSLAAPRRSTCRDLRLDYGRCSSDSPNLPIFGKTPRSTSLPASTVSDLPEALSVPIPDPGRREGRSLGRGAGWGRGAEEGSGGGQGAGCAGTSPMPDGSNTSDLYDMLIRSNMGLSMADGTPTALTPPGAGHQAQGRDKGRAANDDSGITLARPTTPGRTLPAGWHEHALQELDSLTLTLSQLKRSPSRGRLAASMTADSDREEERGRGLRGQEGAEEDVTADRWAEQGFAGSQGGRGAGGPEQGGGSGGHWEVAAAEGWEVMADEDADEGSGERGSGAMGSGGGYRDPGDGDENRRAPLAAAAGHLAPREGVGFEVPISPLIMPEIPGGYGGLSESPERAGEAGGLAGGVEGAPVLQQRQEHAASPPRPATGRTGGSGAKGSMSPVAKAAQQQQHRPSTPTTRAALRRQLLMQQQEQQQHDEQQLMQKVQARAPAPAAAAAALVDEAEFGSLPAWCNRQLTLEELNRALEGMNKAVASRPHHYGALSSGMDDAAAGQMVGLETLQDLGFDQAKGRAIFNCLSKLGRAQLQRANGGAVAYRLVGQGS